MKEYLTKIINQNKSKDLFWIALLFLIVLATIAPIILFGIPNSDDLEQHFRFAQTYYQSILSGDIFPSWPVQTNQGFGDIGIRFYPPLGYYVLAFARILAGNWYDASWLTFIFWMFTGALGVYLLAKEWLSPGQSAAAATIYILIPYHLVQLYQYFLYAEFVATSIIPFCFLFVTKISRRGKSTDIFCLAVAYAFLILSHIPLAMIGSICLVLYAVALSYNQKFFKTLLKTGIAMITGLLASSFHWLKIVTEINWVNHASPRYSTGHYDYYNNFLPMFISSPEKYFEHLSMIKDLTFGATIMFVLPLIILLFFKGKTNEDQTDNKDFRGLAFIGLLSIFMSSLLSNFVWKAFPVLQKVQFPFRWLSIVSVVGGVSFVIGVIKLSERHNSLKPIVTYSAIIILMSVMLFNITQVILPSAPLPKDEFEEEVSNYQTDQSFDCWWTIWSKLEAFNIQEKVLMDTTRTVKINNWNNELREFEIGEGQAGNVRIATFFYPYWHAEINNRPVELQKADDGTILINVPNEKVSIKLFFQEPLIIKSALILSISVWLFLLISLLRLNLLTDVTQKGITTDGHR